MNINYKIIFVTPVILAILLSACNTGAASAQQFEEFGSIVASGVNRNLTQSSDNCPTPASVESDQAVVNAADPEQPVTAEHPEGIPSPAERDDILGRVNLGIDRPAEEKDVTGPEPGSETELSSSSAEIFPDDDLGKVNPGLDREQDETTTGMSFFAAIISFLQGLFGSTSVSSASEQVQIDRTPCP